MSKADSPQRIAKWEDEVLAPSLERVPETRDEFSTASGIPVERVYLPRTDDPAYWERVGLPGEYPFTRGAHATMYRGRPWTRRQVVGLGTARDTNRRHRYVMSQGQTGLSNDFDHPTLLGLDSDDSEAQLEVGRVGVAIDTIHDMDDLFKDIPLDEISTSFTINHPSPVVLAMYVAVARSRGVPPDRLTGTLQNDPLKEFYAQKTFVFPPRPSVRLLVDTLVFCNENTPKLNPINIGAYQARDAGCTADQEIAFAFAEGIAYIEETLKRGLDIDDFAPRLSFLFNVHMDFFEEIAKFRAARRIWAQLLADRFGAKRPESLRLRMHVQTGGATLVAQEPLNNIIRGTVEALAAAVGGTQSMAVSCYDEAYSIPSEHAQKMSLRVMEVLTHESGVANTVDPIAGSYFVESLTDELETRVWRWLEDFDARGGMIDCVESGYIEQLIADEAHRGEQELLRGERTIVGVNDGREADPESSIEVFLVDPDVGRQQIERLTAIKESRDQARVDEGLASVREAARSDENVMPAIIGAVEAEASMGEIMGSLKAVVGAHKPQAIY
jgi:methylmalonyl-CoA mutase, N-terminal domain